MIGLFLLLAIAISANAAPAQLAKSDRSLWPLPLNTPNLFDFASTMEALVYAKHINAVDNMSEAELAAWLGLKSVDMNSVHRFSAEMKVRLLRNMRSFWDLYGGWNAFTALSIEQYNLLHNIETSDILTANIWKYFAAQSMEQGVILSEQYTAWYANADSFYAAYAYEQYRLAALFPKITSEILEVNPSEFAGAANNLLSGKHFIMTFDDGPSKHTPATVAALNNAGKTGIFFILKPSLQAYGADTDLNKLYMGMTRAIHGTKHEALTKPERWQDLPEFIKTIRAVTRRGSYATPCYFRPPYGQRTPELVDFLDAQGCRVMLWNIDSQDWQKDITAAEMQDRLTSLILLWRSGIILFHDVQPKAAQALPELWKRFDGAGVKWE
ncbi:MAG: polysaccharide deacetylase family protein [Deferribacteraceae bacterium]|nr:polysaccharide deacetylase family protein [Deferribacteraceae bacterium]